MTINIEKVDIQSTSFLMKWNDINFILLKVCGLYTGNIQTGVFRVTISQVMQEHKENSATHGGWDITRKESRKRPDSVYER